MVNLISSETKQKQNLNKETGLPIVAFLVHRITVKTNYFSGFRFHFFGTGQQWKSHQVNKVKLKMETGL